MNKLNKNPQHTAQMGYNSFPMRPTLDMTNTVGYIVPVFYDFLYSGDKITFKPSLRTRTNPLAAPANAVIDENIDTFFVPMNQLYTVFGDWYNNIKDFKTDFLSTANPRKILPNINPAKTFARLYDVIWSRIETDPDNATRYQRQFNSIVRLMDSLGVPVAKYMEIINSSGCQNRSAIYDALEQVTNTINPFFFAAYQKIFFDYYRLDDRVDNDPEYYNFDSYAARPDIYELDNNRLLKLTDMHQIPWKRDYYRNVFVSPSVSSEDKNIYGIDVNSMLNNWLGARSNMYNPYSQSSNDSIGGNTNFIPSFENDAGDPVFTAFNVRSLFAISKMLEITRRAGKHYDKQTLAHLGVTVPMGIAGEVMPLGHHEQALVIGDVISSSNTYDEDTGVGSPLGELAGKGYSGDNTIKVTDTVNFTAPCEGILLSVYYARPDATYNQNGLDKLLTKVDFSNFWHPELDNLGPQPKFIYEVDTINNSTDMAKFYGWEYAYSEHKEKMNRVLGDVSKFGTKHYWTLSQDAPISPDVDEFVVSPFAMNDIMLYKFQSRSITEILNNTIFLRYNVLYESDPLINHFEFIYNKASKMSTYSLLKL